MYARCENRQIHTLGLSQFVTYVASSQEKPAGAEKGGSFECSTGGGDGGFFGLQRKGGSISRLSSSLPLLRTQYFHRVFGIDITRPTPDSGRTHNIPRI